MTRGSNKRSNVRFEHIEDTGDATDQDVSRIFSSCKICGSADNSRMVCCDTCGEWYHFECVGVNESIANVD